jgi:hypothetical protein
MLYNFEQFKLNESSYSKVMRILHGQVPSIYSIGIITWENPLGEIESTEYNKKANIELENKLYDSELNYIKLGGMYGVKEKTYLILNVNKTILCNLGLEGNQETVIYGERVNKNNIDNFEFSSKVSDMIKEDYIGMNFKLINTENPNFNVISERNVVISRNDYSDFYSEIKGRRFLIPFFDANIPTNKQVDFIKKHLNKIDLLDLNDLNIDLTPDELKKEFNTSYIDGLNKSQIDNIYNELYKIVNTNKKRYLDYSDAFMNPKGEIQNTVQVQTQIQEKMSVDDRIELERLQKKAIHQVGYSSYVTKGKIKNILKKYNN